ncbi:hypothetical protein [Dactylosporangium sp. NPDC005555]|uniref:hypothetical protein n=1 Tax=Dactylosporangium sp. NPDC005555 TaxID=3154889 RepID=UPI00339E5DAE
MSRSPLASAYAAVLASPDRPPGHPAQAARDDAELTMTYQDRFLPAPAFLGDDERRSVVTDLRTVYDLLRSLPDRLFGGDVAALARAVGMDAGQTALISRSARTGPLLPLGRADLHHDGEGFRLLEFNLTSALGGYQNPELNRAMLRYRPLHDFVELHGLRFRDTVRCMALGLLAETLPAGRPPLVVVTDTTPNFAIVGKALAILARLLTGHGVEAVACDLGRLRHERGRVSVDGRTVDVVLRYFLVEDLTDPVAAAQIEALLAAVEAGRVGLCSRLDSDLYGSKGALAMLSDDRHRDSFDAAERACIDRFLPWTRPVLPVVRDPGGTEVDLLAYARSARTELILKPTLLHGGNGIVAGWRADDASWERQVTAAMSGPYVLQQRVRPMAEPIGELTDGRPRDEFLNWGIYLGDRDTIGEDGYAGGFIRGSADPDAGVVSMAGGASVGCVFYAG